MKLDIQFTAPKYVPSYDDYWGPDRDEYYLIYARIVIARGHKRHEAKMAKVKKEQPVKSVKQWF